MNRLLNTSSITGSTSCRMRRPRGFATTRSGQDRPRVTRAASRARHIVVPVSRDDRPGRPTWRRGRSSRKHRGLMEPCHCAAHLRTGGGAASPRIRRAWISTLLATPHRLDRGCRRSSLLRHGEAEALAMTLGEPDQPSPDPSKSTISEYRCPRSADGALAHSIRSRALPARRPQARAVPRPGARAFGASPEQLRPSGTSTDFFAQHAIVGQPHAISRQHARQRVQQNRVMPSASATRQACCPPAPPKAAKVYRSRHSPR